MEDETFSLLLWMKAVFYGVSNAQMNTSRRTWEKAVPYSRRSRQLLGVQMPRS